MERVTWICPGGSITRVFIRRKRVREGDITTEAEIRKRERV